MRTAKACVYGTCFFDRLALAEQKNQLARLAGLEFYRGLNRRTWIESRPITSGQAGASQGCGLRERAVTPDELLSIASHRKGSFTRGGEGHAMRKLVVVGVARENRAFLLFHIGNDLWRRRLTTYPQH